MRLLCFVSKRPGISPGQRFRLEQWAPRLLAGGIHLDFRNFEPEALSRILYREGRLASKGGLLLVATIRRLLHLLETSRADGAVVYREAALIGPPVFERALASLRIPFIYDFDDAIWVPQPSVNSLFARLRFPDKTAEICRLAAAVSVGNRYLADHAQSFGAKFTAIVPTTVDVTKYGPVSDLPAEPFTVVWTGSHSTLAHLEHARPALEAFGQTRRTRLRIICDRPPARPFANIETEFVSWMAEREETDVAVAHVGIMPLPDDEFTRGKCGLKALQYMAARLPVVASPVGVNREIVRNGETGFLAATRDEWISALDQLAAGSGLRSRLGAAGRESVERFYSAEVGAQRFAELVRRVFPRPPRAR